MCRVNIFIFLSVYSLFSSIKISILFYTNRGCATRQWSFIYKFPSRGAAAHFRNLSGRAGDLFDPSRVPARRNIGKTKRVKPSLPPPRIRLRSIFKPPCCYVCRFFFPFFFFLRPGRQKWIIYENTRSGRRGVKLSGNLSRDYGKPNAVTE